MTTLQKLERKFGKFAIPGLMKYICVMYVVGYFIFALNPNFYMMLSLDASSLLHGQIWRIITCMFYPPSMNPIMMLLAVFVYYSLGSTLEQVWGSFYYTYFFFQGLLLLTLGAFAFYFMTGISFPMFPTYMTFGIFLAYALTFPESVFLFYFLIPIKAKWLAAIEIAIYCVEFITGSLPIKFMIGAAVLNVVLFFFLAQHTKRKRKVVDIKDFK